MLSETKVSSKYQTVVPSKIRKQYDVEPGDILEWEETDEGVLVTFRKRRTLKDIIGIISVPSDAVELKKKIQRGEA
jgi:AbrB family looped-hinge helix DNA binding protein